MQKLPFLFVFSFVAVSLASDYNPSVDFSIGFFSSANNKSQEDCATVMKKEGITFLGVFDGHAGYETAFVLERDLPKIFFESIIRTDGSQGKIKIKDALLQAINKIEQYALETFTDGSTVAVGVKYKKNTLHLMTVGDSKIILERDGAVQFVSQDHNFEDPNELKRVLQAHGQIFRYVFINSKTGQETAYDWRINGLNMTRSIGDRFSKGSENRIHQEKERIYPDGTKAVLQLYTSGKKVSSLMMDPKIGQVIATPDYTKITLTPENRWLILATDGFSDFIKPEDAIKMILEYDKVNKTVREMAELLVEEAIKLGSYDNVTVIVHDLHAQEK